MKHTSTFFFSFVIVCLSFIGCTGSHSAVVENDRTLSPLKLSDHTIQAVLWQQNAAEYRALSYQAFNVAQLRLNQFLKEKNGKGKKAAIITDIDETVMDNTPSSVKNIEENQEFSEEEWAQWVNQEKATEVPGAAKFLNYAKTKGVEVFYVSNRVSTAEEATIRNMKTLGFPYADKGHLLLRTNESSKKKRFEQVRESYDVLLYLGDNLSDFSHQFEAPSTEKRNATADNLKSEFGNRFIVLPNPIYGDWETKGIFKGKYNWTAKEKDSLRRAQLKSYH